MASGRAHAAVSAASSVVLGPVVSAWTTDFAAGAFFTLGSWCGILLSPDLDQEQVTISEAIAAKIPLFGWAFRLFYYPYAWLFPHRSPYTHLPVLGTIIRALYTLLPFFVCAICLVPDNLYDFLNTLLTIPFFRWYTMWFFVGLATSDALHWFADGFPIKPVRIT